MSEIVLTKKEAEGINELILLLGVELSNLKENYVWPIDLRKKFDKSTSILERKAKISS